MAGTEELKIIVSAEDKATRELQRLEAKLNSFQKTMKTAFSTKLDAGILNSKAIDEAFKKITGSRNQIHDRYIKQANNELRQNRLTYASYDALNAQLAKYVNAQGQVNARSAKAKEDFVDLTRKARAYEQTIGRAHEAYIRGLNREQQVKDQVERAKDRLGNLGFQNESRRRKALETSERALSRQRSREYIREIREKERSGLMLDAQRSRNFLARERAEESARRSLEAQRSRAYEAEERRKQAIKTRSWAMQMRQDEKAQRDADRAEAARERGLRQQVGRGAGAAASIPGQIQSAAQTVTIAAGIAGAVITKIVEHGFSSRSRTSSAEGNLQMFGGMSPDAIRELRQGPAGLDRASVANGFKPAAGLNSYTEVIKAGIPQEAAMAVTKSIMGASAGLDLNVPETTKLVGRLSTLTQDPKNFQGAAIDKMLNGIAVVAKVTAADSNELVSSLRRGAGVLGSSKMSVQDLTAFTGVGISTGMQQGKAGTFMDFLVNELVGAKDSRGMRKADLAKGAQLAGLGDLRSVSRQAANDPTKLLLKLFTKMASLSPDKAEEIANKIGMREWRGEMLQMMKGLPMLKQTIGNVNDPANDNHLKQAKDIALGTLPGLMRQIGATSELLWEGIGRGIEGPFRELGRFLVTYGETINLDVIQTHVQTVVDGFVNGLGFGSVTELLQGIFGTSSSYDFSTLDAFHRFGVGLGQAVRDFVNAIKAMMPKGGLKAETLGYWAASITAWATAITAAGPAIQILSTLGSVITSLGIALIGAKAGIALLGMVTGGGTIAAGAGAAGAAGAAVVGGGIVSVALVGIAAGVLYAMFGKKGVDIGMQATGGLSKGDQDKMTKRLGDWAKQRMGEATVQRQSFNDPETTGSIKDLIQKASYTTGYDDRGKTMERLADSVNTMGARFQLASLSISGVGSALGTSLGGGGGGGSAGSAAAGVGDPAKRFGNNFFTPEGMKTPGWYGKGSGSGSSGGGGGGGSGGALAVPDIGPMTDDERNKLGLIMKYEGGYKNQMNYAGKAQGLDPNTAKGSTAQGYFQILNSNWRRLAPKLGIKTTNAMSSSLEDQSKVALALMRENPNRPGGGIQNWSNYNPSLRAALARGERAPTGGIPDTGPVGRISPDLGGMSPSMSGLRVKGAQATGGGRHEDALTMLTQGLQNGGVAGGFNQVTAFNDHFHQGRRSKHNQGLASDFTINDPRQSAQAAEQVRERLRAAGLAENAFKVIDEYRNPSGHATGGHIHTQFNSREAAAQYKAFADKATAAMQPKIPGAKSPADAAAAGWKAGAGGNADALGIGVPASATDSAVGNVPMGQSGARGGAAGGGGGAGATYHITQQIHGGSNSPSEIANLAQRKITEDWNHRAHDLEPELA